MHTFRVLFKLCFIFISLFKICYSVNGELELYTKPEIPFNKTIIFEPGLFMSYTCFTNQALKPGHLMRWYIDRSNNLPLLNVENIQQDYKHYRLNLYLDEDLHNTSIYCAVVSEASIKSPPIYFITKTFDIKMLSTTKLKCQEDAKTESSTSKPFSYTNSEPIIEEYVSTESNSGSFTWVHIIGTNIACIILILVVVLISYKIYKKKLENVKAQNEETRTKSEFLYEPVDSIPFYDAKALMAQNKKLQDCNARRPLPDRP